MKHLSKRGDGIFGMSFGVIFSIILIIFIIATAIYAIVYFMGLNKCTQVGLFFHDLQDEIDRAWQADNYDASYDGTLPASGLLRTSDEEIKVCFGTLSQIPNGRNNEDIQEKLKDEYLANEEHNVFIFPPDNSCPSLFSTKLKHVNPSTKFFCTLVDKTKSKVHVKLRKSTSEALVNITET